MSVRPSSQKKSCFPLKPGLFRCDQPSLVTNREEFSSDESDCNNVAFHRPKCPWGRRRSYIQKIKKTAFFDSSVTCIPGRSQSPVTKKPWLNSSVSSKNNDFWQRPLGKKKGGVHCFCTRQEQAKITPPYRKRCSPDWIETRRNHIVNKFDGFSKNILKITGKLSEETISMITAKIKENSEKDSDLNLKNTYNSSIKGAKRVRTNKKDLIDNAMNNFDSGKVVPVGEKYSSGDKSIFLGNKNNYLHSNELFTPSNNELALARDRSILIIEKGSSIGNEIPTVDRPASVNNKNSSLVDRPASVSNKASNITERPTTVSSKTSYLNKRPASVGSNTSNLTERPSSVSSKTSYLSKRPASVSSNTSNLTERPVSVGNKISYLLKRPKSVGDKSLTNGKKPKSYGDKTFQRPSSGGNKCLYLRERSVSFGENSYTGDNASTIERPISARDKTPPWAGHKPSQFYARRVSIRNNSNLGDNTSSNNDKLKSAGDKILQLFDSSTSENKIFPTYAIEVPVGENTFVDNNSTGCIEIPMLTSDNIPQSFLNLSPKNESSFFQEKNVLYGENIYISDNALSCNENPLSASTESPQPILSLSPKIETSPLHEKYVPFSDSTYVGHDAININEKSLSAGKDTSNAIERFSIRNKLSHFHARTVSFSDNTVYFDKPLSASDKSSLLDVSQESPDDKNLYFNQRPTVAYKQKKQDRNSISEIKEMKSSLDLVKSLQPVAHKNVISIPCKNSLQISARKKILLERNVKKKGVHPNSNDYPTGYTVQLVKLKNYHIIEEDLKK